MPGVIRLAALHARQPHLGGAEEQRVDLVEIAVVPLEDVVERRPVVLRCRRGNLGNQLGEFGVIGLDGIARLAAVQDAVVGAADRPEIVLGDRRGGRPAPPPPALVHVGAAGGHLLQAPFPRPPARPPPALEAPLPRGPSHEPAHGEAMRLTAGWSVPTRTPGHVPPPIGTGGYAISASPPVQISASARPAPKPPVASIPASMTRAPPESCRTATRSAAAFFAIASAICHARSLRPSSPEALTPPPIAGSPLCPVQPDHPNTAHTSRPRTDLRPAPRRDRAGSGAAARRAVAGRCRRSGTWLADRSKRAPRSTRVSRNVRRPAPPCRTRRPCPRSCRCPSPFPHPRSRRAYRAASPRPPRRRRSRAR